MLWIFDVGEIIFDIPSKPEIKQEEEKWSNTNVVNISKDARTRAGVKYYLYCISKDKNSKNCKWNKTKTKNVVVKDNGINYVFIKAVNEDGKEGKISDPIEVKIDNEAPEIEKITKTVTTTTIKVKIDSIDKESGIDKYYYKIDNEEFTESSKNTYTFKDLTPDTTYKVTIKVVDKLGNEKEVEVDIKTKALSDDKNDTTNDDDKDNKNDNNNNNNSNSNSNNNNNNSNKNNSNNNNNNNNNKPNDKETTVEIKEIPKISLEKVPTIFTYGEKYTLPSSYTFGKKGGVVSCTVEGKESKDTSTIGLGTKKIECTATSHTGPSVKISKVVQVELRKDEEKIFDGWITMNLYYPKNSTNWKWRLGKEETRKDEDGWKDYTGPITIKLTDVENVYIKYTLPSGEEVIVAPKNQLVVDIEPENYAIDKNQKTKVTINYDKEANTKEYRLNGGDWQNYTGEFEVSVNTQIDARAIKRENIYEGEELISSKNKISYDSVYISEKQEDSSETGGSGDGNQGTGESGDGGSGSDKEDSNYTQIPDYVLEGPTIKVNPSLTITSSVKVKIETQEEAEEIYYKEGSSGKYKKYTKEFRVDKNEMIYTYYITKEGQTSKVSEYNVSNIKIGEKPYINISLNQENLPKEVEVSISGEDYDTLEYSTNGKIYFPYEGSFKVTKNGSIYAKATNKNGTTEEIRTITEFSSEPPIKEKLDVAILVNPDEKEVEGLINKAKVTINYDEKATNKYYKTSNSDWTTYTGSFEIEKNTTIYAYAENENAYGETVKSINYLTTGISGPTINANTTSPSQTVNITIDYSKNASVKKYKIDDGDYIDYTGPFNVDENCKIYAYNKDLLGNEAESSYTVSNIVEFTRELLIDKGDYFILKLNYPENSKPGSLKYKWSEDGEWENYDGQGILLIKKEYKDKIITDGDKAQIEDEYGNKITFTGNYYILETSISEMMANLYMKWEYKDLNRPDIIISPTDATKVAKVIINYNDLSTEKLYKVVNPDGTTEGWKTYSLPITIRKNNTIIYAKSYGENDTVSEESTKLISNIDEENPKLNIVGNLKTPIKKLSLQIIGEDDLGVERVGYAKGSHDAKYFEDKGEILKNRSVCNITENGIYTFYVEDTVGNITIKEIEITNINSNASDIDINVLTSTYGTEAEVEIDYGFNKTKQYKIGEKGSYKTYKEKFTIKSLDVLNYANPDGTLTLYARGVDSNGEEQIEKEIIYVLDLDMPKAPNIRVDNIIYPTVTLYGVESKIDVIIDYDDRDDINNYYSLDGGKTWELYQGPLNIKSESIIAKSVKKASGLEISSSKDPEKGSNALKHTGYDEDIKTCYGTGEDLSSQYFNIAPEMVGKYLKVYGGPTIYFYNSNDERFNSASVSSSGTSVIVPEGAVKASISGYRGSVCDVMPDTAPVIETEYNYPTVYLHSVEAANNVATITYKETAVKKQYKIDDGKWKSYQGPIKLGIGETLYARSIDKNDHESIISTYKSENNSDALPTVGYDEDKNTCYYDQWGNVEHKYFEVAEEMIGARLKLYGTDTLYFYNKEGKEISSASVSTNPIVPEGTVKVRLYGYHSAICEVMADTTPIIETTYTYPKLYLHGMEEPYNTATISYRDMAIKKQYKINDGEWKDYTEPVKVKIGDIITARSIDKYGRPGIETTYKSENNSDALPQKAFDNDTTTCYNDGEWLNTKYFDVAEEMIGKTLIIYGGPSTYFYDSEGNELGYEKVDGKPVIPSGTVKARVYGYRSSICEIKIDTTPVIEYTYTYPEMTTSGMQDGYNTVTISYNELAAKRQYKINDEDWKEYTGPIRVEVGDNLTARSIDSYGNEGITASYESVLGPQAINPKIYDGDTTTCLDSDNGFKFTVNDDMIGQSIKMQGPDYYVYLYDQDSKQISVTHYNREQTIDVVEGTKSIMIAGGWTKICEVEPVIAKARSKARARVKNTVESQIPTFEKEPTIDVSNRDKYTTSKDVNISYPNGYINEYSFDAENWNTYKGKITVEENVTIYARTRKDNEIVSTSSYKITKIDKGIPKISLDGIPDEVEVGSDYKIPSMYDFNSKSQNGTIECYANSQKISNIKELIEGTYNIKCTITTESGMKNSIEKSITIKSQKNNQEQQPNVEEKQIPSVEEKGTTPEIENENKNNEGENKNEEANKEETTNEQKINEETEEKSSE